MSLMKVRGYPNKFLGMPEYAGRWSDLMMVVFELTRNKRDSSWAWPHGYSLGSHIAPVELISSSYRRWK